MPKSKPVATNSSPKPTQAKAGLSASEAMETIAVSANKVQQPMPGPSPDKNDEVVSKDKMTRRGDSPSTLNPSLHG